MTRRRQNSWEYLFVRSRYDEREEKVLCYVVYRIKAGAHLADVQQEEYVLRNASSDEVEGVIRNPEVINAAKEGLESELILEQPRTPTPSH